MMKNYTRSLILTLFAFVVLAFSVQAQVTITQWTFTGDVITPETGSGAAALIGGTTATFATGVTGSPDRAWNSSTYPDQGTGSGTAGVEFAVSTASYSNIAVSWDGRHSNTSANRVRVQYTINGSDWVNFEASATNATNTVAGEDKGFDNGRYIADAGDTWYQRSASFAAIGAAGDNAAFAVRMVTEFFDGTNYAAATPTSTYGTGGTLRYDNVTFTGGGSSASLSANPGSLSGFTYIEGTGPSEIQVTALSGFNLSPAAGTITVTAPADYAVSSDGVAFVDSYTFNYASAAFSGVNVSVRLKAGLAAGSYSGAMTVAGGGAADLSVNFSGSVTLSSPAAITSIILPKFIQGAVPNNTRVPFAYHATLSNLLPSSTYRFYNKIVLGTDGAESNGAGNCIFVDASAGTFTRTSSTSLLTVGQYGEFITNASGSYSGWFMTEPTGNATRFKPGTILFARIMLNDGAGGTTEATRLTSEESMTVIGFNTISADTTGTAIRGTSDFNAKNFVFLYDNTAGTGRPIYGTQVEATGVDFAAVGSYAAFYTENVATTDGAWGGIVPNVNAAGVKRIEERSLTSGAVLANNTSDNGVWGTTDTKNPSGGLDNVLVINTTLGIGSPVSENGKIYTYGRTLNIELAKAVNGTVQLVNLYGQQVAEFSLNGTIASYTIAAPAGIYIVRMVSETGMISSKVVVK